MTHIRERDMADNVGIKRDGAVATVVLDDPPNNAISLAMVDCLERLIAELEADRAIRAIIVTAAGDRAFSVGANIKEFGVAMERMGLEQFIAQRLAVIATIENLSKPVIAAINGLCIGGGLELALGCHFRMAARGACLGLPEIELGIVPAWGGTQRLTRTVGRAHALDMMLRARLIDADEALRIGLVHSLHNADALASAARSLADELSSKAPLAVAGILAAVVQGGELRLQEGLAVEMEAVVTTGSSQDSREGVSAFLEKRRPRFRGE